MTIFGSVDQRCALSRGSTVWSCLYSVSYKHFKKLLCEIH